VNVLPHKKQLLSEDAQLIITLIMITILIITGIENYLQIFSIRP